MRIIIAQVQVLGRVAANYVGTVGPHQEQHWRPEVGEGSSQVNSWLVASSAQQKKESTVNHNRIYSKLLLEWIFAQKNEMLHWSSAELFHVFVKHDHVSNKHYKSFVPFWQKRNQQSNSAFTHKDKLSRSQWWMESNSLVATMLKKKFLK